MVLTLAFSNTMSGLGIIAGGLISTAAIGSPVERYSVLYFCDGATFILTGLWLSMILPREIDEHRSTKNNVTATGYLTILTNLRASFSRQRACRPDTFHEG